MELVLSFSQFREIPSEEVINFLRAKDSTNFLPTYLIVADKAELGWVS